MNEIAHIEELDFEFLDFDRSRKLGHEQWFRYILQAATEQMGRFADSSMDEVKTKLSNGNPENRPPIKGFKHAAVHHPYSG